MDITVDSGDDVSHLFRTQPMHSELSDRCHVFDWTHTRWTTVDPFGSEWPDWWYLRVEKLYRQHHFHERLYGHWYVSIHFWFCRPVSCGIYDYVKGTASPPDLLSYPSSTIVTCNTGHTKGSFMWFGRKFVLHFCVVFTDIFCALPLLCL